MPLEAPWSREIALKRLIISHFMLDRIIHV
jgi:hypothetical protein